MEGSLCCVQSGELTTRLSSFRYPLFTVGQQCFAVHQEGPHSVKVATQLVQNGKAVSVDVPPVPEFFFG